MAFLDAFLDASLDASLDVLTQTRAVPAPRPKPCEDPCPEGHDANPDANPDHHLWRNGRLWWAAFSLLLDGWRQERVRCSLGTADICDARRRRDALLAQYAATEGCELRLRREPSPRVVRH